MGGGTTRFELIESGTIEGLYRKAILINNYDELFIECEKIQGVGNLVFQLSIGTATVTTRFSNFLTDTDKTCNVLCERLTPVKYLNTNKGTGVNVVTDYITLTSNATYEDKISKLVISTGVNANLITSCNYKIYGRNLTNI